MAGRVLLEHRARRRLLRAVRARERLDLRAGTSTRWSRHAYAQRAPFGVCTSRVHRGHSANYEYVDPVELPEHWQQFQFQFRSTPIILVYFVQYIQLWRVLVAQIRDSDYAIESDMKRGQLVLMSTRAKVN